MRTFFLAFLLAICSFALDPKSLVSLQPGKVRLRPSVQNFELVLDFKVQKGYHVQANPATYPNLIPTTLTIASDPRFKFGTPIYPPAKPYTFSGGTVSVKGYAGNVQIRVPAQIVGPIQKGKSTLKATFRYQACDDKNCFFPVTSDFEFEINVSK